MPASARTANAQMCRRALAIAPSLDRDSALLQLAGPLCGERVLIIGTEALELLCAALRRGAAMAMLIRQGARPEERSADLVIVTEADSPARTLEAILHAGRALAGAGRILLDIGRDPAQPFLNAIVHALRRQGFSTVRLRHIGNRAIITGSILAAAPFSYARRIVGS
ncbi:MAG TPA: hypothetical protein VG848_04550 [Acetobacteraceae bacterium]|jgi:hypothetical protein|nr:hypothetical protein [Acetobacteraceae bacterium]